MRRKGMGNRRSSKMKPRPVTPEMLARALKWLHKSRLFGTYFTPVEVTQVIAWKYAWVEQNSELLLKEVDDKLMCAAAADIIGHKIGSGYHLLSSRSRCVKIDTRSELTFWLLYKQIREKKRVKSKGMRPPIFFSGAIRRDR